MGTEKYGEGVPVRVPDGSGRTDASVRVRSKRAEAEPAQKMVLEKSGAMLLRQAKRFL